ncbi:DNA-protecting protein DprA [Candidatus Daviesbacteria bacterium]|nr:DNA-protecting protein DprA [Candidatus Daviesbacteria bacterium]
MKHNFSAKDRNDINYQEIKTWQKILQLQKLCDLSTPPKNLYFQGRWNPNIFENCVAIVGSRKMTDYGQQTIEKIIPQLIQQGKTVVSGFMYGVDKYAHKICIDSGGTTIAVLGWGINKKLDGEDSRLANKIINGGGILLSEWESQQPTHWTFPARNRIVAALAQEVIVVEAVEKSGSLITARIASRLKRTLWAVPGPITSRTSVGTNNLIASGKAKVWLGTFQTHPEQSNDPILQILEMQALTADELARKLDLPISDVGAKLSMFLLSGQVTEKGGKYYHAS